MQDIADIVKARISCLEEGKRMGLDPDRAGFCRCPFHQEKTGSMKLYSGQRGWHCFGCGAGGDVINLVMRFYRINFRQALLRLDTEWGLGLDLTGRPVSPRQQKNMERERWRAELNRQTEEQWHRSALELLRCVSDLAWQFAQQCRENAPTGPYTGWNEAYRDGLRNLMDAEDLYEWLAVMMDE